MPLSHTDPVSRRQAREILADPHRWSDRPSLIQLARMIAASAEGLVVTQRRLAEGPKGRHAFGANESPTGRPVPNAPHLRVVDGGLSGTAPRQAYRSGDALRGFDGGLG